MRKLIINGKEITAVRFLAGDSKPEQYAAAEFAKYLEKLTGIVPDTREDSYPVHIGIAPAIGHDGLRIRADDGLWLFGGNGRGVIYSVYEFLERYAGCRFFMPDLETLGEGNILVDKGYEFVPVIEFRQSDWHCGKDLTWSVKRKINNRTVGGPLVFPEEMGGNQKYGGGFVHTMRALTGEDIPCLSDPENLRKVIDGVRKILKEDPAATIISVSQNDGLEHCTCEKCTAVEKEEGSYMGPMLRLVNAVADDIREDYPDVVIDTLSYRYTRHVPKLTKPRPNVCIRLCSIECCFSHPLNDPTCPENQSFHNDIVEWGKICNRIYIWDYVTNFSYYIAPFPNFGVLRENMRFFADHGVRGMYPEGNINSPASGEFGELRCYLLAKLMWDPYMSTTEYYRHMDEFLSAYYGEGWRYIRAFIDFTTMEAAGRHIGIYLHPFRIIPKDRYEAMEETIDQWWNRAEEMAGDRLEAVRRSRMQWRYMKLMLHPNAEEGQRLLDGVKEKKVNWSEWKPFPEDYDFTETPDLWLKNYPG